MTNGLKLAKQLSTSTNAVINLTKTEIPLLDSNCLWTMTVSAVLLVFNCIRFRSRYWCCVSGYVPFGYLCHPLCSCSNCLYSFYCHHHHFHHQSLLLFFTLNLKHTSSSSLFHRICLHRYSLDWSHRLQADSLSLAYRFCFSFFR